MLHYSCFSIHENDLFQKLLYRQRESSFYKISRDGRLIAKIKIAVKK